MKAYRLTDPDSIKHALARTNGIAGRSGEAYIRITGLENADNVSDRILFRTDADLTNGELKFTFKTNSLTVRAEQLEAGYYSIKDVVLETAERTSERVQEIQQRIVRNILISPPVDVASSVALYGKTPVIAQACQMMRMMLTNHLNSHGFLISEAEIGFFYNNDNPIFIQVETDKKPFFIIDALQRRICTLGGFTNPLETQEAKALDAIFTKFSRSSVRSQLIYPFSDPLGNIMGFFVLQSTMPGLGDRNLSDANRNPGATRLFVNFLRDRAEDLVFEMEVGLIQTWLRASEKEVMLDMSQNGRGCRITLHGEYPDKILKRGSKLQFEFNPGDGAQSYQCTVRNIARHENRYSLGLRINRGSAPGAMEKLAKIAAASQPGLP